MLFYVFFAWIMISKLMLSGKFGLMLLLIVMMGNCLCDCLVMHFNMVFSSKAWPLGFKNDLPSTFSYLGLGSYLLVQRQECFLVFYYTSIWLFKFIELCVWWGVLSCFTCPVLKVLQISSCCVDGCFDSKRMQENS